MMAIAHLLFLCNAVLSRSCPSQIVPHSRQPVGLLCIVGIHDRDDSHVDGYSGHVVQINTSVAEVPGQQRRQGYC